MPRNKHILYFKYKILLIYTFLSNVAFYIYKNLNEHIWKKIKALNFSRSCVVAYLAHPIRAGVD
jgi:hypothetical protein